ncbi:uncharacterized protein LOC128601252 isoform X2 [Ictalurus furcatus]|uniref:uncharacterized protein LOC128601252 isoform X2 n=1 Tax=Ictalurus furcatus TaxID=66913 RepID=UPI002350F741|nr:uncharacterized protein LOC128601252 isoform X2 [Ictalurus furcatus]
MAHVVPLNREQEVVWDLTPISVSVSLAGENKREKEIMYRHVVALQQLSRRTLTSTARRLVENKVPQKQKLFQVVALETCPTDKYIIAEQGSNTLTCVWCAD